MNKQLLIFFLFGLFIFSCQETKQETEKIDSIRNDSTIHVDQPASTRIDTINLQEKDTLRMGTFLTFSELSPVVMHDNALLYSDLSDTTIIKKTLPILTSFKILEKAGIYFRHIKIDSSRSNAVPEIEYTLKHPLLKIEVNGDTGYISSKDICYYHLKNSKGKTYYFVNVNEFADSEIIIYKYDELKKKVLDSLPVQLGGSDSEFIPDFIKYRDDIALKNAQGIIEIYRQDEYCGGGSFSIFVVDANNSLSKLISMGAYGEVCEGSSTSVTFPFIKNGDTIINMDWKRRGLKEKVAAIVKDRKIPIHQIIPRNVYAYGGIYDENEETCKENKVSKNFTILNYWDGYKLNKIDSINHLK